MAVWCQAEALKEMDPRFKQFAQIYACFSNTWMIIIYMDSRRMYEDGYRKTEGYIDGTRCEAHVQLNHRLRTPTRSGEALVS